MASSSSCFFFSAAILVDIPHTSVLLGCVALRLSDEVLMLEDDFLLYACDTLSFGCMALSEMHRAMGDAWPFVKHSSVDVLNVLRIVSVI